jgi:hypothetical protein
MSEIAAWIAKDDVVIPGYGVACSLKYLGGIQQWIVDNVPPDEVEEGTEAGGDGDESDSED